MTEIEVMGEKYEYEISIDQKRMIITDPATGEWAGWNDDQNNIGDPDYYDDWEDWIYDNWDNLDWTEDLDHDSDSNGVKHDDAGY